MQSNNETVADTTTNTPVAKVVRTVVKKTSSTPVPKQKTTVSESWADQVEKEQEKTSPVSRGGWDDDETPLRTAETSPSPTPNSQRGKHNTDVDPDALKLAQTFYERYKSACHGMTRRNELQRLYNDTLPSWAGADTQANVEFNKVLYAMARGMKVLHVTDGGKQLRWNVFAEAAPARSAGGYNQHRHQQPPHYPQQPRDYPPRYDNRSQHERQYPPRGGMHDSRHFSTSQQQRPYHNNRPQQPHHRFAERGNGNNSLQMNEITHKLDEQAKTIELLLKALQQGQTTA